MHSDDTARQGVWLDAEKRLFFHGDKKCRLKRGQFALCAYLSNHPGVVKTRSEILDVLHGEGFDVFDASVDARVKRARNNMRRDFGFCPIKTSQGVGYYWEDGARPPSDSQRPDTEVWLDLDRRLVMRGASKCELTRIQFDLCAILAARPDAVKSREYFFSTLYRGYPPAKRTAIDTIVKNARKNMQRDLGCAPIVTCYGDGYYWSKSVAIRFTLAT